MLVISRWYHPLISQYCPISVDKSTISMTIFPPSRVNPIKSHYDWTTIKPPFSYGFPFETVWNHIKRPPNHPIKSSGAVAASTRQPVIRQHIPYHQILLVLLFIIQIIIHQLYFTVRSISFLVGGIPTPLKKIRVDDIPKIWKSKTRSSHHQIAMIIPSMVGLEINFIPSYPSCPRYCQQGLQPFLGWGDFAVAGRPLQNLLATSVWPRLVKHLDQR